MFTVRKRNFARFAVVFLTLMLVLTASMTRDFAYANGEKYSETEISEANKALDEFMTGRNSYLITNGGTWNPEKEYGKMKSDDGLTYTIGYKMSVGSEADFTSLNFNFNRFDKYRATVFFEGSALDAKTAPNGSQNTIKIKRRPKTQDIVVNARLALFRKSSVSTHVQQGKVDAIAERNIKIILKAPKSENAPVRVSVKVFDKESSQEILKGTSNLALNVYEDQAGKKIVYNLDAKYDYNLEKNRTYYLSAKADGYEDFFEAFVPKERGEHRVLLTKKDDGSKESSIWNFDKDTKTLKGYKAGENYNNPSVLEVPASIDGVAVERIDKNAFKYALWGSNVKNSITELYIPASVKIIEAEAFKGHKTLTKLSIEDGSQLEKIGDSAFMSASLDELSLPASVREVEDDAFSMNNIKALTLPEGLEKLGRGAFGCNLIEKVTLPSTLKELPKTANGVFYKNFSEKAKGSAYKGQLRYVQVIDKSGIATTFNTGGVVNPVPVTIKYVNQFGESIREDDVVYGCNFNTTYEQYGKVSLGAGDKSFLNSYRGSNGTNTGNTATEIFKQEKLANAIIGENFFRDGKEYIFSKNSAPYIEGHIRPQEDVHKTISSTDNVVEFVYQTKEKIVVDKTELQNTIRSAEESKKDIKISSDGKDIEPKDKWTTSMAVEALDSAITAAKSVDENTRVRQEAVDKAKVDLQEAINSFEASFKQGMKEEAKPLEPEKPEPGKAEPANPVESEKPEPGKTEPVKPAEPEKPDSGKTETIKPVELLKPDTSKTEPVKPAVATRTNNSLVAPRSEASKVSQDLGEPIASEKKTDTETVRKTAENQKNTELKAADKNAKNKAVLNNGDESKDKKEADKLPNYLIFIAVFAIAGIAALYKIIMAAKQR